LPLFAAFVAANMLMRPVIRIRFAPISSCAPCFLSSGKKLSLRTTGRNGRRFMDLREGRHEELEPASDTPEHSKSFNTKQNQPWGDVIRTPGIKAE
jgi:hypothetical protein